MTLELLRRCIALAGLIVACSSSQPTAVSFAPIIKADTTRQQADTTQQKPDSSQQKSDSTPQKADTVQQKADTVPQKPDSGGLKSDTTAKAADTTRQIFLLAGQSNMAGRGTVDAQDSVVNPRVLKL